MKTFLLLLLTLISGTFVFGQQGTAAKNVEDYFYVLPADYFMCDVPEFVDTKETRQATIRSLDVKNGYLEASASVGTLYAVLYKNRVDKKDIIAVYVSCGQGCMCETFDFLEYRADSNSWKTADVVPWENIDLYIDELSSNAGEEIYPLYKLPREGTTITATDPATKKLLFELKWNGQRFSLVKPQ